ncbi:MAG: hypothetical protein WBB82_12185 [Limnothrix sp.]
MFWAYLYWVWRWQGDRLNFFHSNDLAVTKFEAKYLKSLAYKEKAIVLTLSWLTGRFLGWFIKQHHYLASRSPNSLAYRRL